MYTVFTTREFDKDFSKLDPSDQEKVRKILNQIKNKGSNIGKPLACLTFFREKKFGGKRLYYLERKEHLIVLILVISDKKAQQATINTILASLSEYRDYINKLRKN